MTPRDIATQYKLLDAHRGTLATRLLQLAIHGTAHAPTEVISDIDTARERIAHCKAALRGWGVAVEDHPDDQDASPVASSAHSAAAPYLISHQAITVNSRAVNIYNAPVTFNQTIPVPTPNIPRQLPSPDALLIGRDAMITEVRALIETHRQINARVMGFDGLGGAGKTTFAIHLAHQLKQHFPDGQIFLRLRGTGEAPLLPEQALRQIISAFEPQCQFPADLDVEAHYRSILSDKRVLILADDMPAPQYIQVLNPPPGSLLLITSRERFFGRVKILWRALPPLTPSDAIKLLRIDCERLSETEAATIASLCGYLPLALCISTGLLTNDPGRSISRYIADLTDQTTRLQQLRNSHDPTMNIEAVLTISYQALPQAEQAALAQIGAFVTDFDYSAASAIVELPGGMSHEHVLSKLRLHNLLTHIGDDRNNLHDLVRIFARQQLSLDDDVYLRYARHYAAHSQHIYAGFPDNQIDLEVLRRDWPHIEAGWQWTIAWSQQSDAAKLLLIYAEATLPVFDRLCARDTRLKLLKPIPSLAGHTQNRALQAAALIACGNATLHHIDPANPVAEHSQAHAYYAEALAIAPDLQHEARAYIGLGLAALQTGDLDTAAENYIRSRSLARDIDDQHIYCLAQNGLGTTFVAQGRLADASTCYQEGLSLASDLADQRIAGKLRRDWGVGCLAQAWALDQQNDADERRACLNAAETSILRSSEIAHSIGDSEGRDESDQLLAFIACAA